MSIIKLNINSDRLKMAREGSEHGVRKLTADLKVDLALHQNTGDGLAANHEHLTKLREATEIRNEDILNNIKITAILLSGQKSGLPSEHVVLAGNMIASLADTYVRNKKEVDDLELADKGVLIPGLNG